MVKNIKVLVLSHNAFSDIQNNGKTLESIFCNWDKNNLAQIFIHEDKPDFSFCTNYFSITDKEILRSFISRKEKDIGRIVIRDGESKIGNTEKNLRIKLIINRGFEKRLPFFTFVREKMWKKALWKSERLVQWINDFDPDFLFFQGSNCSFMYMIAGWICEEFAVPMVLELTDDYTYIDKHSLFDRINKRIYIKKLSYAISKAKHIIVASPRMQEEYQRLFGGYNYSFIMNSPNKIEFDRKCISKSMEMLYTGNITLNRWQVLLQIGKALDEINNETDYKITLKIYTPTAVEDKIIDKLQLYKSIYYGGSLRSDQVIKEMEIADWLVHVESFKKKMQKVTRLSISTKISEYLGSNRCIFAVGPDNVASIAYLKESNAAKVCTSDRYKDIKKEILDIIGNEKQQNTILKNASDLYRNNHQGENIQKKIESIFYEFIIENQ